METLASSSGPLRCLLESGELPAFWLRTPNRERLSMDSKGSKATAMGKLILQEKGEEGECGMVRGWLERNREGQKVLPEIRGIV